MQPPRPTVTGLRKRTPSAVDRIGEIAGSATAGAARRFLDTLPPDLSGISRTDIEQHLLWVVQAANAQPLPPGDASGVVVVLRRRILDCLRANLLAGWATHAPQDGEMLHVLSGLERARDLCTRTTDEGFTTELSDVAGPDLVVEIGHDMRSPLTSILFLSEVLHKGQSGPLSDVQKHQIGIIYSAALGLVGMASDMIEIARGGDSLASRRPEAFSVTEMLHAVRDLVAPTAEEKGLRVQLVHLPSDRRLGYPVPLTRVLLNLTTNALKFTQEGEVQIAARPVGGNMVEFSVTDTGCGIAEDALATLYQPFRREPRRESGYYFSGTGLGLAICRRIVTALNAELELETGPKGSRFSFRLDLPPAELL